MRPGSLVVALLLGCGVFATVGFSVAMGRRMQRAETVCPKPENTRAVLVEESEAAAALDGCTEEDEGFRQWMDNGDEFYCDGIGWDYVPGTGPETETNPEARL